ncbi:hypothetical protein [Stappia sp.]|uniref:hypothetical protein n=1 Tax=Stappia sp. TaxID=1870903 RepID=UPI003A99C02C
MSRQISIFSPADVGAYPLRVVEFPRAPGSHVARGDVIVRLEGPRGALQLAAPFDATILKSQVLTGTTLETRTALLKLNVAKADIPSQPKAAAQPPRGEPEKPAAPTTAAEAPQSASTQTSHYVHPAFADLAGAVGGGSSGSSPRGEVPQPSGQERKRRRARTGFWLAGTAAVLAFVWWSLPETRRVISYGMWDRPFLLMRAAGADMRLLPTRVVSRLGNLAGFPSGLFADDSPGFAMADSGTAKLRCTGKRTYFFAGSLFTGGKESDTTTEDGLATVAFDFDRKNACMRFGKVLTYQDGSLHDDLGPQNCADYARSDDIVSMFTFMAFGNQFQDRTVLELGDMRLRYTEGEYNSEDQSNISQSTAWALTCVPAS